MAYNLLDSVGSPADIRNFSMDQLRELCAELREYMIECCAVNPGHLGSSLGAVELVVGLHYVYDTPLDKVVFDVGHQAYAHKIITGRREAFRKNRMRDGISGFPKRAESEYDAFGAGHSSTSISAALGFAEASKQLGLGHKTVALIGDGSLTGGLALEGMNNAGAAKSDLLVILNDNNISIDRNIGALHEYLLHITSDPRYNKAKKRVWDGLGDGKFRSGLQRFVVNAKSSLVRRSGGDLFEAMGFRYFGPVDGNDISQVVTTLRKLKALDGPILLHTLTKKGKGYAPAEADQTVWHAPGMFDPETGERIKSSKGASRYQDVFGQVLLELARMDSRVVGVTPAMASGCGMNLLSKGLPVVLCLDRSGIVGEDGPTHHGCYDMAIYRSIPGAVIAAPKDEAELKDMMYSALKYESGPYIIRYPRGYGEGVEWRTHEFSLLETGKGELVAEGSRIAVIAAGPVVNRAVEAAAKIREEYGWSPSVYNIRYVKPLDGELMNGILASHERIVTIEDGTVLGGLHGAVAEFVSASCNGLPVRAIGIPDRYVSQGTQGELWHECGLSLPEIIRVIVEESEKNQKKDRKILEIKN